MNTEPAAALLNAEHQADAERIQRVLGEAGYLVELQGCEVIWMLISDEQHDAKWYPLPDSDAELLDKLEECPDELEPSPSTPLPEEGRREEADLDTPINYYTYGNLLRDLAGTPWNIDDVIEVINPQLDKANATIRRLEDEAAEAQEVLLECGGISSVGGELAEDVRGLITICQEQRAALSRVVAEREEARPVYSKILGNLLAYSRRYANGRPSAAADVTQLLTTYWPVLPEWERQQHLQEMWLDIKAGRANLSEWEAALALADTPPALSPNTSNE